MVELIPFAHFVLAVDKRLMNHFGLDADTAKRIVEGNRSFVYDGYMRRYAADRVARILADRYTGGNQTVRHARYVHRRIPIVITFAGGRWGTWVLWPDGRKLFAGLSTRGEKDAVRKGVSFIDKLSRKRAAEASESIASECGCQKPQTALVTTAKCPCEGTSEGEKENPLPAGASATVLWLGAMVATAVGVFFLADALKAQVPALQPSGPSTPPPNFTPQGPEVLQTSFETSGPYGTAL